MAQPVLAAVPLPVGGWQAKDKTDLLARAYTKTCTEAGIPMRPAGLFPPGEKTLAELVRTGGIPVSKHLWSADEQRWLLAEHSFVAGNEAAGKYRTHAQDAHEINNESNQNQQLITSNI
jgi:hypothetical protein